MPYIFIPLYRQNEYNNMHIFWQFQSLALNHLGKNRKCDGPYLQIIEELELAGGLGGPLDSLPQGHSTGSTFGPVGAAHGVEGSGCFGHAADQIQLQLSVCPAGSNHHRYMREIKRL